MTGPDNIYIVLDPQEKKTHLFDVVKAGLLNRVLARDDLGGEVDVDPRVPHATEDVVEAHVEATQQQHALVVHAQLGAQDRDAVVVQLALVEHDVVEEADGVAPLEELDGDRVGRRREVQRPLTITTTTTTTTTTSTFIPAAAAVVAVCAVAVAITPRGRVSVRVFCTPWPASRRVAAHDDGDDGPLVRGAVAPVEGPHDLADAGARLIAARAPLAGVRDPQHVGARLVDGVEGIAGVELDAPPRRRVRDAHHVVAEDHLRHRDPEVPLHRLDRPGLGDGQLAARYHERALLVRVRRRR